MPDITITYRFTLTDGSQEVFDVRIDEQTLELHSLPAKNLPKWTALDYHQCPNCPLSKTDYPCCPLAVGVIGIVTRFDDLLSHDAIHLEVITKDRSFSHDTTAQRAISSLMGLIIATCGCPRTAFLRPMACFHLPLATEEETIYRAASMYALAQYYVRRSGQKADLDFKGLDRIYREIQGVNTAIAERLRAASEKDASVNAVIILDLFAKALPDAIQDQLEEIRYLFETYFKKGSALVI